ncbi:MAG: hypothetical protein CMI01_06280 [Oceanospirillaceae bacterium]|nr:hypothetical protein [Oceanospirillaceae bacterium]
MIRFTPNTDQQNALNAIQQFLQDPYCDAFVLRGGAGTGKTTIVPYILEMALQQQFSITMLSPTGRASRIMQDKVNAGFSQSSGYQIPAQTLHKFLYYLGNMRCADHAVDDGEPLIDRYFPARQNDPEVDLLIIDEASMVGDKPMRQQGLAFGSGRLLSDLIRYVREQDATRPAGRPVKLIIIGDPAQLPPVGDACSPAMAPDYLNQVFGLQVQCYDLTQVVRQKGDSALLEIATALRNQIVDGVPNVYPLQVNYRDIQAASFHQAVDLIAQSVVGEQSAVAVARTNRRVQEYNEAVRATLYQQWGGPMYPGDRLLVMRNNRLSGLQNGDLLSVHYLSDQPEVFHIPYGKESIELRFRQASVGLIHQGRVQDERECLILENLLDTPTAQLGEREEWALQQLFMQRHPNATSGSQAYLEAQAEDPYLNALVVKYGYAMTCHKAQGGEWGQVIIDLSGGQMFPPEQLNRWIYTAITRASERVILVNPPHAAYAS